MTKPKVKPGTAAGWRSNYPIAQSGPVAVATPKPESWWTLETYAADRAAFMQRASLVRPSGRGLHLRTAAHGIEDEA